LSDSEFGIMTDRQENIFKFNQRRLTSVKYLGELYMYRAVSASVIFDTLWSLISFGHRKLSHFDEFTELIDSSRSSNARSR
jgi:hypothetical protein